MEFGTWRVALVCPQDNLLRPQSPKPFKLPSVTSPRLSHPLPPCLQYRLRPRASATSCSAGMSRYYFCTRTTTPRPTSNSTVSKAVPEDASQILATFPCRDAQILRIGPIPWRRSLSCIKALCALPQLHRLVINGDEDPPQLVCELLDETSAVSVALLGVRLYDSGDSKLTEDSEMLAMEMNSKCALHSRIPAAC